MAQQSDDVFEQLSAHRSSSNPDALLRFARASTIVPSDVVLSAAKKAASLASKYDVAEQAAVAALHLGRRSDADAFLRIVASRFPTSERTARLQGMCLESEGKLIDAVELYDDELARRPAGAAAWQRKVAVLKKKGDDVAAAKELAQYLTSHGDDADGWLEMCELQLSLGMAEQAAFCLEELLLVSPSNAALHARLAEVLFACGSLERFRDARLHAAEAVRLSSPAAAPSTTAAGPAAAVAASQHSTDPVQASLVAAWPLVLLAESSYLHFCHVLGIKVGPKDVFSPLSPAGQRERIAAVEVCCVRGAAADGGTLSAAAAAHNGGKGSPPSDASYVSKGTLSSFKSDATLEEDVALHALAVERIVACAAAVRPVEAVKRAQLARGSSGTGGAAPPAVTLALACLLPANVALLQQQAATMMRVVEAAAASAAPSSGSGNRN